MSPLLYLVIGLIGGGLIVAVVVLLTRRGNQGAATDMAKRLETIDRSLRDEFSRNREEAGAAAKNQREELARSLERRQIDCGCSTAAIAGRQRTADR